MSLSGNELGAAFCTVEAPRPCPLVLALALWLAIIELKED